MIPTILAVLFAVTAEAGVPTTFRLSEVLITIEQLPRWPTGEIVVARIGSTRVRVERTALPCEKCQVTATEAPFSETKILELLNQALRGGFFQMTDTYSEAATFFQMPDGQVQAGSVVTTDEDRIKITVAIGEWSHAVMDEGEAPCGFKELARALRDAASSKQEAVPSNSALQPTETATPAWRVLQ